MLCGFWQLDSGGAQPERGQLLRTFKGGLMMKCTNSGVNNLKTLRCFERLHDSLSFPGVFEEDGYAHGKYRIAVPDAKSFKTLLLLAVSVLGLMIAPAMRG
jgi:hypothetical protein